MGCDIHVHIEVKMDGTWHHFAAPDVGRNYRLFAIMAGERLESLGAPERARIRPVARIHGLPDDMSAVTRTCLETDRLSGIHNKGTMTAEDLERLQEEIYRLYPGKPRTESSEFNLEHGIFRTDVNGGTMAEHAGFDDLRLLFWFEG